MRLTFEHAARIAAQTFLLDRKMYCKQELIILQDFQNDIITPQHFDELKLGNTFLYEGNETAETVGNSDRAHVQFRDERETGRAHREPGGHAVVHEMTLLHQGEAAARRQGRDVRDLRARPGRRRAGHPRGDVRSY